MKTSITIQNLDAAIANWLFAEAQKRNVSVETLTLELLRKGMDNVNDAPDRKEYFRQLERQHAEGYAKYPIQSGEFADWETEQVWGEE